ncbi:MAG: hypothetical protein BWY26_00656 [Elusimicrobia bacterium ADurb.Bin231]|nr:MAG: hypothetical protein BWY26_00656 [Elusimicrobia bacterium ADurb.Bin231]
MLAIIGGIISLIGGILLLFGGKLICGLPVYMWDDFLICLKGTISIGFVLGGIIAVGAGISALKDKIKTAEKN